MEVFAPSRNWRAALVLLAILELRRVFSLAILDLSSINYFIDFVKFQHPLGQVLQSGRLNASNFGQEFHCAEHGLEKEA